MRERGPTAWEFVGLFASSDIVRSAAVHTHGSSDFVRSGGVQLLPGFPKKQKQKNIGQNRCCELTGTSKWELERQSPVQGRIFIDFLPIWGPFGELLGSLGVTFVRPRAPRWVPEAIKIIKKWARAGHLEKLAKKYASGRTFSSIFVMFLCVFGDVVLCL